MLVFRGLENNGIWLFSMHKIKKTEEKVESVSHLITFLPGATESKVILLGNSK